MSDKDKFYEEVKKRSKKLKSGGDDGGKLCYVLCEVIGKPNQDVITFEQTARRVPQ